MHEFVQGGMSGIIQ